MEGGARVHRCVVHFVLNLSEYHCDDTSSSDTTMKWFFFSLQPIRSLKIQLTSSKETAVHAFILSTQRCGGSHLHTTSKITAHSFKAAHCLIWSSVPSSVPRPLAGFQKLNVTPLRCFCDASRDPLAARLAPPLVQSQLISLRGFVISVERVLRQPAHLLLIAYTNAALLKQIMSLTP